MPRSRHPLSTRLRWFWHRNLWVRWNTGVLAVLVLYLLAVSGIDDGPATAGRTRPATVATRDLEVGHTVTAGDVETGLVPLSISDTEVDDPVGRVVTGRILAGEPLVAERLAPEGMTGAAALVPPGHRAVALPVTLAAPPVTVGDRVDVLVAAGEGRFGSEIAARDAPVVAVSEEVVTVALRPEEATVVADGLAAGLVTLALQGATP